MIVKELIKQLMDYPMDAQVVLDDNDPIMYCVYARNAWMNKEAVRLEPKSQMDINTELDAYFEQAVDSGMSDYDTWEDLKERGYTLDDLKNYREDSYEWARKIELGLR